MTFRAQTTSKGKKAVERPVKSNSCMECRKSKKKCDQKFPSCTLCYEKGKTCKYSNSDYRKPATRCYTKTLQDRVKFMDDALEFYKRENANLKAQITSCNRFSAPSFNISLSGSDQLSSEQIEFSGIDEPSSILSFNDMFGQSQDLECESHRPNQSTSSGPTLQLSSQTDHLKYYTRSSLNLNLPLLDEWKFSAGEGTGALLFSGLTSMRFSEKPIYNPRNDERTLQTMINDPRVELLEGQHKEVFDWFFAKMDKTIPLINKARFWKSVNSSILQNDFDGAVEGTDYISNSLINAIMAFHESVNEGITERYVYFKDLSTSQVDKEIRQSPSVTSVQVLVLLSIINMTEGNEIESSNVIARAVSLSYHLGLHADTTYLLTERVITEEEALERAQTFWCCFVVDKLRGSIMGISPLINCPDLTVKLPNAYFTEESPEKIFIDTFTETITFAHTQSELLSQLSLEMRELYLDSEENKQKSIITMGLSISKGLMSIAEWRKNMLSNSRFVKNKSIDAAFLEILQYVSKITLNKQLVVEPLTLENSSRKEQSCLLAATESAETILKLIGSYSDFSQSLFGYHFVYAIYTSAMIFLYNMTSADFVVRNIHTNNFKSAHHILEMNETQIPVTKMYLGQLKNFQRLWGITTT